jgi:hypothetical protein
MVGKRAAALALGVLVLSGCSSQEPIGSSGLAADSDAFQVTQSLVAEEVAMVQTALAKPPAQPEVGLAKSNAERLVQDRLIAEEALRLGVSVTQTEIEKGVADLAAARGGKQSLDEAALQAGVPIESIDAVVRTNLLAGAIGQHLAPSGDATAQNAAARQALTSLSESTHLKVAPRYGRWDHDSLSIVSDQSVVKTAPIPEPSLS